MRQSTTVNRALDILLAFDEQARELSVREVAARLRLHKSTAHGLLASLVSRGLVVQNPETQKYRLGYRVLDLAQRYLAHLDLTREAIGYLDGLRDRTGETAGLYVRVDNARVCVQLVESLHELKRTVPIGRPLPLHTGASGRVLMAYLPEAEVEAYLASNRLEAYTPATLTDPEAFRRELARVRARGYAIAVDDRILGGSGLAAPVRDHTGAVVAALAVFGPTGRWDEPAMRAHIDVVVDAAARLSRDLGYLGDRSPALAGLGQP